MDRPRIHQQQGWDPRAVLQIQDPDLTYLSCTATCTSDGRRGTRCRTWLDEPAQVNTILTKMATMDPELVINHRLLHDLARITLCEGLHGEEARRNTRFITHRTQRNINQNITRWEANINSRYSQGQGGYSEGRGRYSQGQGGYSQGQGGYSQGQERYSQGQGRSWFRRLFCFCF
jgi:hypothetical protein